MNERIAFLKDHLPDFLVENREVYGILSNGIHELSDEQCLAMFDPLRLAIRIILEEDKRKKDQLELRVAASKAIRDLRARLDNA